MQKRNVLFVLTITIILSMFTGCAPNDESPIAFTMTMKDNIPVPDFVEENTNGDPDTIIKNDAFRIKEELMQIKELQRFDFVTVSNVFEHSKMPITEEPIRQRAGEHILFYNEKPGEEITINIMQNTEENPGNPSTFAIIWDQMPKTKTSLKVLEKIISTCTNDQFAKYAVYKYDSNRNEYEEKEPKWNLTETGYSEELSMHTIVSRDFSGNSLIINLGYGKEMPSFFANRIAKTEKDYRINGNLTDIDELVADISFFNDVYGDEEVRDAVRDETIIQDMHLHKIVETNQDNKVEYNFSDYKRISISKEVEEKEEYLTVFTRNDDVVFNPDGTMKNYEVKYYELNKEKVKEIYGSESDLIHKLFPKVKFDDDDETILNVLREKREYKGTGSYDGENAVIEIQRDGLTSDELHDQDYLINEIKVTVENTKITQPVNLRPYVE